MMAMAKGKWGESFLKSGLPLEHLTMVTLKNKGWQCEPGIEVFRPNRERKRKWFELDLEARRSWKGRDCSFRMRVYRTFTPVALETSEFTSQCSFPT